jgi:tRNA(Ser,Leu) C12 N-acetylase TAN1
MNLSKECHKIVKKIRKNSILSNKIDLNNPDFVKLITPIVEPEYM